ncbi:serine/threonine-protein kinase Chk2 isoform X3 [Oreochromis niloticus]|uniref:serine/threonine-protein kinase Chk2 isoform X3 n=1 Tax=Oreochromis niloticus TaxID=8128 RepID=UPI000905409D|nr:serine/threonine-protein kinase Chk2 isoform X3 [Oreochromis niloticus]
MSEEGPPQSQTQSTLSPSQAKSQSQSQPGSSSSSGPTSASQSSSGSGTLSSVDTIPVTLASVPEEPEPQPWGRLLPMVPGFRSHDCIEDQYLFGRDSRCNYVLEDPNDRNSRKFRIYSKKHFRIYREGSEVFVEDLSNNGTFLDGIPIGKDKKLPLVNNAVISLAEQRNRVFVFIDLMSDDQSSLPRDLQEKYLLTRRIGIGVCGEVRLAFERSTCRKFAVKIINKKNFQSEGTATRNAKTEIEILQRVDHPCLIKTEDFYQTEESFYIVLELMEGGELFHRVKSKQQLNESVAKLYFYQMLRAVQYLHSNGIIHRDLKPENILLSSQDDVCLIKPGRLPSVPRELWSSVGHRSDHQRRVHHGSVQVEERLGSSQRRGEEAAGRRSDEEDEHRGSSAAPLATGPEDVGDGTQAHVPVCRGRGAAAAMEVESTSGRNLRKRGREGDGEEQHPAKRSQALPSSSV